MFESSARMASLNTWVCHWMCACFLSDLRAWLNYGSRKANVRAWMKWDEHEEFKSLENKPVMVDMEYPHCLCQAYRTIFSRFRVGMVLASGSVPCSLLRGLSHLFLGEQCWWLDPKDHSLLIDLNRCIETLRCAASSSEENPSPCLSW